MIDRGFANIVTTDVDTTSAWYTELLGWDIEFQSDWFVHLKVNESPGVELGIINSDHEIAAPFTTSSAGSAVVLTIVVADVDATHDKAMSLGYEVLQRPTDLFYGQRRMVLRDPSGTLVDVSSECSPSEEFLASLPHRSVH